MTAYKSAAALSGIKADLAAAGVMLCRSAEIVTGDEFGIESIGLTDSIYMVPIPKGAMILDIKMLQDSIFTSDGMTWNVGDGGTEARYGATVLPALDTFPILGWKQFAMMGRIYDSDSTINIVPLCSDVDSGHCIRMHVYYKMTGTIVDETAFS